MKKTPFVVPLLLALAGCSLVSESPKVISGLSPEAARDEIRRLKAANLFPKAGVIVELEGTYVYADSTFELGAEDGGVSEAARVTYRGVGAGAVFTGGRRIPREMLKPCGRSEILSCDLKALGFANFKPLPDTFHAWNGMELFVGEQAQTLARYPNKGWLTFNAEDVVDRGVKADRARGEWEFGVRGGTFRFPEGDTHPAKWNLAKGVWLHGFWACDWASDSLRVASVDAMTRNMTMKGIHTLGIGPMHHRKHEPRRYFVYNTLDELDEPGEWYVDREEGLLYFWPVAGQTGELILVDHEEPILRAKCVPFLSLENLTFTCNTATAAEINDCDSPVLDGVEVRCMTRLGLEVKGGRNALVTGCRSRLTGGSGFEVSGGDRKRLIDCNHRVTGCDFSRPGRLVSNAHALGVRGCGIMVDHNYIHDTPYIGMTYNGNNILIEHNEVAFAMMESGDGGGMYTGRDWCSQGNVLRYNYLHHFGKSGADWKLAHGEALYCEPLKGDDSSGIYLDDCDSGDLCVSNVMFKTGRGFLVGGGRDNFIRDNLMVGCELSAIHIDARGNQRLRLNDGTHDGWDMAAKLRAMDWTNGVWATTYPWMADYLTNDPLMPVRTAFTGNVALNCKSFFGSGWDKARGMFVREMDVAGNLSIGPRGKRDNEIYPTNGAKDYSQQVKYLRDAAWERLATEAEDVRDWWQTISALRDK